ncbi:HEAT repeat domain-containing protein [Desulfovibrio sp. DV]|uniref:HEAT repeat domain-containing protein n=1 Tax=Desulfovibrio sp. DV TaxID=1844708 RepID=UPI00094BB29E|nr:HEAT repeat domain-containing protein [Desulfovibrio sp. DV]
MPLIIKKNSEPFFRDERKRNRDCCSLLEGLADPDPTTRRWAARDCIDCLGAAAALVGRLKVEQDISVREVIFTTLTRMGDPLAVAGLVAFLRSEDPALRNEAIEAMKQLPDEMAPILRNLLADADPDVRIFAVNILESLRHPQVEAWLLAVIDNDLHINVCSTAVDLLCEVGTEAALEPLARLKARFADEPYIQFATALALARIGQA